MYGPCLKADLEELDASPFESGEELTLVATEPIRVGFPGFSLEGLGVEYADNVPDVVPKIAATIAEFVQG